MNPTKPRKPRPDFPLFPHATGRWSKKVRGKLRYFGSWRDDPKGERALALWLDQKDLLLAGREPQPKTSELTVEGLCDAFLQNRRTAVEAGELERPSWDAYRNVCVRLVDALGGDTPVSRLRPTDFDRFRGKLASEFAPTTLAVALAEARTVLKFAVDAALVDTPIVVGNALKRPSKRVLRKHKAEKGHALPTRDDVLALARWGDGGHNSLSVRAWALLALNCGMGAMDVASLPLSAVDLDRGWLNYPRPKTGVERRAPFWIETVEALRAWLAVRPKPKKGGEKLVFLRYDGTPWLDKKGRATAHKLWQRAAREVGCSEGPYDLRRLFAQAARTLDPPDDAATRVVMGHVPVKGDMLGEYAEVPDARLERVAGHIRKWLYGSDERG